MKTQFSVWWARKIILYAVGANSTHGKRAAVTKLLEDPEWVEWSDREIARRCNVSDPFVGKVRAELYPVLNANVSIEKKRKYITKHGTPAFRTIAPTDKQAIDPIPATITPLALVEHIATLHGKLNGLCGGRGKVSH